MTFLNFFNKSNVPTFELFLRKLTIFYTSIGFNDESYNDLSFTNDLDIIKQVVKNSSKDLVKLRLNGHLNLIHPSVFRMKDSSFYPTQLLLNVKLCCFDSMQIINIPIKNSNNIYVIRSKVFNNLEEYYYHEVSIDEFLNEYRIFVLSLAFSPFKKELGEDFQCQTINEFMNFSGEAIKNYLDLYSMKRI